MATTLATLRTNLTEHFRNRQDLTTAKIDAWINGGNEDFATKIEVKELQAQHTFTAIITPTRTFAYPTFAVDGYNAVAILEMHDDTNDEPLFWEDWKLMQQRQIIDQARGFRWTTLATTIYLSAKPEASTVFSATIQKQPAVLSNPSDEPELLDQFRYGIELLAEVRGWHNLGDPDRSEQIEAKFNRWRQEAKLTLLRERRSNLRRRRVRPRLRLVNPSTGV